MALRKHVTLFLFFGICLFLDTAILPRWNLFKMVPFVMLALTLAADQVFSVQTAMVIGAVIAILLMLPLNLIFTPLYGTPIEAVKQMLFPVILPFNAIKFGVNAVVAWLLYKPLQSFLKNREK